MTNKSAVFTLIKLGGSVITDKQIPQTVRTEVLNRLVEEIAKARAELAALDEHLIVGHGQGSFAHVPALKYRTKEGFVNSESLYGMAVTQASAAGLNRIVVDSFLHAHVPAVSFLMSNSLVTNSDLPLDWSPTTLLTYIEKGLLPVTGGDVLVDEQRGCTIWSTEQVLAFLAEQLQGAKHRVARIVHVTEVAGLLDDKQAIIPLVTPANYQSLTTHLKTTKGFDVTGGMEHKLTESLQLLNKDVESVVLGGLEPDNLYRCLVGQEFVGTRICQNP